MGPLARAGESPQDPAGRSVEELIASRRLALLREAQRRGGRMSPARLAELQALMAIAPALAPVPAPARRDRWPLAAAMLLTMLLASALLYLRTPTTEIELEASVSELQFVSPVEQVLTQILVLRSLQVAGADAVSMSDSQVQGPGGGAITLQADAGSPSCAGTITLDPMLLPAGSRVRLRGTPGAERLRMSLLAPGMRLHVTVDGCVKLTAGGAKTVRTSGTRSVTVGLGSDEADIDMAAIDATPPALAGSLSATALSLARVEQFGEEGRSHVRHASTIESGRLFMLSLNGQEKALRPGEEIAFAQVRGELRSMEPRAPLIALRFHGQADGMVAGFGASARDIMPTWLEWLRSNQSLSLLWGSVLYALGLFATLLKWWQSGDRAKL